jgi:hypothetical protein
MVFEDEFLENTLFGFSGFSHLLFMQPADVTSQPSSWMQCHISYGKLTNR